MLANWRPSAAAGLLARLLAALPLGYAFTALCVSALGGALAQVGIARADAVVLTAMLGFVLYLLWLLWAFAARSLLRVYGALASGSSVAALAHLLFTSQGA